MQGPDIGSHMKFNIKDSRRAFLPLLE